MPKLKPISRSASSGSKSIQEFFNAAAKATEKSSDDSDQATCIEALLPYVGPDDIYLGHPFQLVQLSSTPLSDKRHKPGPVGISRRNWPSYPDIYGSSLAG